MFAFSVLVNSTSLKDFEEAMERIFILLISKFESRLVIESKIWIDDRVKILGKEAQNLIKNTEDETDENFKDFLGTSKSKKKKKTCLRGQFYEAAIKQKNLVLGKVKSLKLEPNIEINECFSPKLLNYIIKYIIALAPMWSNLLLGDIGRHGTSDVYKTWSKRNNQMQCVINPTKTQGFVEKQRSSEKCVYVAKK